VRRRLSPDELPTIPRMPWAEFRPWFFREWEQGDHVSLIGPTKSGKSTMAIELLDRRRYVAALGTKPKDDTLSSLLRRPYVDSHGIARKGYVRIEKWPPEFGVERVLLWPKIRRMEDRRAALAVVFHQAFDDIHEAGGWCVYVDEVRHVAKSLRLAPDLEDLWTLARSSGISVVGGTQRPADVPLLMYDQPAHLFFWRDGDEVNLKRIGGIGWQNSLMIRETVARLPLHDALYIGAHTGTMYITRVEKEAA
jgi:hypothetical protein